MYWVLILVLWNEKASVTIPGYFGDQMACETEFSEIMKRDKIYKDAGHQSFYNEPIHICVHVQARQGY